MKEHQVKGKSTIKEILQAINDKPTAVQQGVLNCLDSFNVDMQKRNIQKQYRIDVRLYDASKSVIIGASKEKDYTIELKYVLAHLDKKGKITKQGTLYTINTRIEIAKKGGKPTHGSAQRAVDQCFLILMRECLGLFALACEQKIKREAAGHANG